MDKLVNVPGLPRNVLVPKLLCETITPAQFDVLTVFASHIPEFNLIVTSTNIIYNGVTRTLRDGPSHVAKQAIDIVLNDPDYPNTIISNNIYSRSLLWMAIIYRLWTEKNLANTYAVGFEPSHFHIHVKSDPKEATFVLFENSSQIKGMMSGSSQYLAQCQGHKPKDITSVLKYLFNT
jgi:hypothetical protein